MQKEALPHLLAALDDEMWDVRYAAEDALVGFGKRSIGPLRSAFAKADARARPHMIEALAKLGDSRALVWTRLEYQDDDPLFRAAMEKQVAEQLAAARQR